VRKVFISVVIILFLLNSARAQSNIENSIYIPKHRKGNITFFWGWNRAKYTTSDIHFWGNDYNFILKDVQAKDHQSAFDPSLYLGITNITIPQYNWRVGYYLTDKYHISVGFDHMKYVMVNDQASVIDGYIHNIDPKYDGNYANQPFTIAKDFLLFEHTDGLNYINSEIRRSDVFFTSKYFNVSVIEGVGAGVLFPKTNCTLMHNPRNDQWHEKYHPPRRC